MRLSVITRDNSPYQGKPKIYVSYYESDRKEVADSIAAMFLKHRNCAVYYFDETGADQNIDDKSDIFKEMQAVVFPVFTWRLSLLDKVSAELELCRKEHIPVIPILMDDMESAAFYKKYQDVFGSYQLLMPRIADHSKLPFDEVLEKHLRNIITSDRESYSVYSREGVFQSDFEKMIQSAFRGSVFLSYRKSDRKLARKMINSIHSDPALTDVMIWFDEYLVTGEDYNDELKHRISNCDVFLILGTEAAVQEENYILTHEYPEALQSKKLIVLVCTNTRSEIQCRLRFPHAKIVIPAEQQYTVGRILAWVFRDKKGKLDDKPLEKSYLLGKAYLDGVLTETDRAAGVSLIEKAADGGYVPAMRLMAHLYHEGLGVETNPEKEASWLSKAADVVGSSPEPTGKDFKELHELIELNWQQGDIRMRQVDFEGAFECYSRILEAARRIRKHDTSFVSFATYEVMALNKLANVRTYQRRLSEARVYLEEALRINEGLVRSAARLGGGADYAETLMMLGNIERDGQNYTQALYYYQRSLDMVEELIVHSFSARAYDLRCDVNESIGIIAMKQGNIRKAEEAFAEEFRLARSYEKEFGEERALTFEMAALRRLGDVARTAGDLKKGSEYYCQSAEYARRMNRLQKSHSSRGALLDILFAAGKALYQIGNYDKAQILLNEMDALILESESSNDSEIVVVIPKVASEVCEMLGNIAYMEKRPAHSRALYKRMVAYSRAAYKMEKSDNNLMKMAAANYKVITSNLYVNDPECTRDACELYKSLYYKYGDERLGDLYRKALKVAERHETNAPMHRRKVAGWASDLLQRMSMIEMYGIRFSDSISNSAKVQIEILEMVLVLAEHESKITESLVAMMNHTLGMNLTVNEMNQQFRTMHMFGSETKKMILDQIPESIQHLVKLEKQSNNKQDYHDNLAFQARIVMDVIGRWALNLMGSSAEKREQLIRYIDGIEMYIENSYED